MPAVGGGDQLCRDPDALAGAPHAAFQHMGHVQCLGDLPDVLAPCRETRTMTSARSPSGPNLRQQADDLFGQAVAEVFLILVRAHVGERQHRDGWLLRRPRAWPLQDWP